MPGTEPSKGDKVKREKKTKKEKKDKGPNGPGGSDNAPHVPGLPAPKGEATTKEDNPASDPEDRGSNPSREDDRGGEGEGSVHVLRVWKLQSKAMHVPS